MPRIPFIYPDRPDFDAIREEAAQPVRAELGAIARPDERARRAAQIIAAADTEIETWRPRRNAAALSLWAYEGHHTRGLEQSMGIPRATWNHIITNAIVPLEPAEPGAKPKKVRGKVVSGPAAGPERIALARSVGITEIDVDQALADLPAASTRVEAAEARRDAAVQFRNAAIMVLIAEPYSMTHPDIAELIGLVGPDLDRTEAASRISVIITRTRAAEARAKKKADGGV